MGLLIRFDDPGYARLTPEGLAAGVQVVWVPNARNGGGSYATGVPYRITVHEIQGGANKSNIESHPTPPQLWFNVGQRILYQTIPLSRSGFALWNNGGSPGTNKCKALQVELSGYSSVVRDETLEELTSISECVIAPLCDWVARQGESIDLDNVPDNLNVNYSAREDWPGRFDEQKWYNFNGMCGHINVWSNDHWDPGAMNLKWIAEHSKIIIGQKLEVLNNLGEGEMDQIAQFGQSFFGRFSGVYLPLVWNEVINGRSKGVAEITLSQGEYDYLVKQGRLRVL